MPTEMAVLARHLLRDAAGHEYNHLRRNGLDEGLLRAPAAVMVRADPSGEDHFHNFDDEEPDFVEEPVVSEDRVVDELAAYEALASLETHFKLPDMSQNPLLWWKARVSQFPILSSLARKYLAVPAASAAVERMFSYTGNRVSKKDCNLGDESLLSLMLVRSLSKFIDMYKDRYFPMEVQGSGDGH